MPLNVWVPTFQNSIIFQYFSLVSYFSLLPHKLSPVIQPCFVFQTIKPDKFRKVVCECQYLLIVVFCLWEWTNKESIPISSTGSIVLFWSAEDLEPPSLSFQMFGMWGILTLSPLCPGVCQPIQSFGKYWPLYCRCQLRRKFLCSEF